MSIHSNALDQAIKVFERDDIYLPTTIAWSNRLHSSFKLNRERAKTLLEYRCWQATAIGFPKVEIKNFVESYMGSASTATYDDNNKTRYDWIMNHHINRNEAKRWYKSKFYWQRYENQGMFSWPPFHSDLIWECRLVKLNDIKEEIPYLVMLRLLQAKALDLFNTFHVIEVTKSPKPKKHLLLGSIFELPPNRYKKFEESGLIVHFLISDWSHDY